MNRAFFCTDLHGSPRRGHALLHALRRERPQVLFLGGDLFAGGLLLHGSGSQEIDFFDDLLVAGMRALRADLGPEYPRIFVILGNDDARVHEREILDVEAEGLWQYAGCRALDLGALKVVGYPCIPPTPFALKDWERYDVSAYVDPGCTSPEEGMRSVPMQGWEIRRATIAWELDSLTQGLDPALSVLLFHAPPYQGLLDRAALDGRLHEGVPLDPHIGSIAIRRFIEQHQPLLTLHGHVHESTRLTGHWRERLGRTLCLQGAHDGPELALIRLDLHDLESASRELI